MQTPSIGTVAALGIALSAGPCSAPGPDEGPAGAEPGQAPAQRTTAPAATRPHRAEPAGEKHRGVSWVAGREVAPEDFRPLVENHVNWIVQTPFGWQRRVDSPEITLVTSGRVYWGETDEGIRVTTELARRHGIRTMLKPHIWLSDRRDGAWRGEIRMASEAEWDKWFESYRTFILHYARLAEANGIEALCIGTELRSTVNERPQDWRAIIAEVRKVYRGRLTYGANWYGEFEEVPFWDDLDLIGIHGYFPLSTEQRPTRPELIHGWRTYLERIARLQKRYGKPVLFTELGYRSVRAAASKPWEWPRAGEDARVDLELQADCYRAFFETFWDKPWFAGVYWWKWYPKDEQAGGKQHRGFTPQNKPAEKVMAQWYGRRHPDFVGTGSGTPARTDQGN